MCVWCSARCVVLSDVRAGVPASGRACVSLSLGCVVVICCLGLLFFAVVCCYLSLATCLIRRCITSYIVALSPPSVPFCRPAFSLREVWVW